MATYGQTRYYLAFFVDQVHQITFYSDIAPPRYDPGEYLHGYDWRDKHGRPVMTRGPYRIIRTEHSIDWEAPQGDGIPGGFFLYVYTVRAGRVTMLLEGFRAIARALFSASPMPTPRLPLGEVPEPAASDGPAPVGSQTSA